jgi:hypothetical protein
LPDPSIFSGGLWWMSLRLSDGAVALEMPVVEIAPVMVGVAASEPEGDEAQADDQPDEEFALAEAGR